MVKRLAIAVGILAVSAMTAGTASAVNKCQGAKIKDAGKKAACLAGLHAKVVGAGSTLDPAKVAKCEAKVGAAYAKLESKPGCNSTGDAGDIEAKVDAFVNDLVNELDAPPLPNKCQGAKIKDAGKKAACLAGLQAKVVGAGSTLDPAKVMKCEAKVGAAYAKLESKPGCNTTGDAGDIESKVDAFVNDLVTELNVGPTPTCAPIVVNQSIPGSYVLNGASGEFRCTTAAPSNKFGSCTDDVQCGVPSGAGQHVHCMQLPWVTADGQIMPFPTGVATTFTVAAADSAPTCEHDVCVPCGNPNAACAGIPGCEVSGNPNGCIPRGTQGCCNQPGFLVPTFFVNILGGLCSRVDQIACGVGVVNTSNPQTGDNEVTKLGDTSDPGADCCYNGHPGSECIGGVNMNDDPPAKPCNTSCSPTVGAGCDYTGKIMSTIGNGSADASGIHYRLTTPELSTTWTDGQSPSGTCANGSTYDDGELLVSQLVLQAQPTTAGATGQFVDMNGDNCSRAGNGFNGNGPITVGPQPGGPLRPQSYDGTVAAVSAAVSVVFSGPNSPIRDIGFVAVTPQQPIVKLGSAVSCSCTPVPGCPE